MNREQLQKIIELVKASKNHASENMTRATEEKSWHEVEFRSGQFNAYTKVVEILEFELNKEPVTRKSKRDTRIRCCNCGELPPRI